MPIKTAALRVIKELQFRSPLRRYFFPRFVYNVDAPHLCFLCDGLERTRNVPGCAVEVGCSIGATTLFLNNYLRARAIGRHYVCIDTFAGFLPRDVEHEVSRRGKDRALYDGAFAVNDPRWFRDTMTRHGYTNVQVIEADAATFPYDSLAPVAFAFLDVDLYLPMLKAIEPLYDALAPGGVMIVDDCIPNDIRYDGSDQAYKEFCAERGITPRVELDRLGVLEKPA